MNKQGWTYKKLGEACDIYQPKTISAKDLVEDGKFLVYGANGVIGRYNFYNHENSEVLLTCRGATCGTINVSEPFSWINGNAMVIHPKNDDLIQSFLVYYLRGVDLSDVITGAAQPQITRQSLFPTLISIPPLAEQERIVEELDLLSGIIEKKKEQLKAYDQLAQSIFYTMFGDPITNEKGWEVKKMGEACRLFAGGDVPKDRFSKTKTPTYCIPIFSNGTENKGFYGYTDLPKVTEKCITISGRGTVGYTCKRTEPFFPIIRLIVVIPPVEIDVTYLLYYSMAVNFKGNGVAIPQLTVPMIKDVLIPIPPLALQQEFAAKVETIEQQKALIQQSIAEVQTLFDSRMDYWFG